MFLSKSTVLIVVLALMLASRHIWAEEPYILKAAVAKEFENGLHSRYLTYIAQQLEMNIVISTMPLVRRIIEVKKGNLDLIVGLQYSTERAKELAYIYPAYEELSFKFFALNEEAVHVNHYEDLIGKMICVVRGAEYHASFEQDNQLKKYNLKGIDSCIKMLFHQRIDLLIHYEESTVPMLKALAVENKISKTNYQPEFNQKRYLAVSKLSPLATQKQQLQAIIERGLSQQDFLKIRLEHYQAKLKKTP